MGRPLVSGMAETAYTVNRRMERVYGTKSHFPRSALIHSKVDPTTKLQPQLTPTAMVTAAASAWVGKSSFIMSQGIGPIPTANAETKARMEMMEVRR